EGHVLRDHSFLPDEGHVYEGRIADIEGRNGDLLARDPGLNILHDPGDMRRVLEAIIEVAVGLVAQKLDALRVRVRIGDPTPRRRHEVLFGLRLHRPQPDVMKLARSLCLVSHRLSPGDRGWVIGDRKGDPSPITLHPRYAPAPSGCLSEVKSPVNW